MTDTSLFSLAHMLAEQEAIRAQIRSLSEKDQALERLIEAARAYETAFGGDGAPAPVVTKPEVTSEQDAGQEVNPRPRIRARSRRPAPVMEATENAVSNIMEMLGEPMQTGQLLEFLGTDSGLNLPEENPLNVLSARLSNSSKFQGRRGKGWWFADRPWPGEEDSASSDGANESGPQSGDDPASGPDNRGLQPDDFEELLGGNSSLPPGSEGHGEKEGGA